MLPFDYAANPYSLENTQACKILISSCKTMYRINKFNLNII